MIRNSDKLLWGLLPDNASVWNYECRFSKRTGTLFCTSFGLTFCCL